MPTTIRIPKHSEDDFQYILAWLKRERPEMKPQPRDALTYALTIAYEVVKRHEEIKTSRASK